MKFLAAALLAATLTTVPADAGTVNSNMIGCYELEDLVSIAKIIEDGNKDIIDIAVTGVLVSNRCILFEKGYQVKVVKRIANLSAALIEDDGKELYIPSGTVDD